MAVGEHEATLAPDSPFDRGDRRPWVVSAGDESLELPRDAVPPRLANDAAAPVEIDGRGRGVTAVPRQEHDCRQDGRAGEGCSEKNEGGPASRAALSFVILRYLIWNVALPVVWFPAMSVASHRNSVVFVTTNDCPGSRGPVASHSVEVLLGFDPSVV